jgi:uncharacterized NAD(P)/FAD-binding protein YdhS
MSVLPDEPNDFVEWLQREGRALEADDFASRGDYGRYLRDRLAVLLRSRADRANVDFIKAKARACIDCSRTGVVFHLDNQTELSANNVVLCLGVGNAPLPVSPQNPDPKAHARIVHNPWRLGWLSKVGKADEICILGSGLTMVDQVLALRAHGHRGRIHLLSRRGLLPHGHAAHRSPIAPGLPQQTREISPILAALRRAAEREGDWRGLMDGLRPVTQTLWQELNPQQRARFLRHALPWWNIHRHRIAPAVFAQFDALVRDGTVVAHAGFLQTIENGADGATLRYRRRGSKESESLQVDWLVNCTGMERAGINHSPLLKEMEAEGMIRPDELGLGISVDSQSQVLGAAGERQPGLFAVGALTAGQFWEITAVPDIRVQARKVAERIAVEAL